VYHQHVVQQRADPRWPIVLAVWPLEELIDLDQVFVALGALGRLLLRLTRLALELDLPRHAADRVFHVLDADACQWVFGQSLQLSSGEFGVRTRRPQQVLPGPVLEALRLRAFRGHRLHWLKRRVPRLLVHAAYGVRRRPEQA